MVSKADGRASGAVRLRDGCDPRPASDDARLTMRRFSQRNSLVTLNEINITPLLDLAFVLLVIFIITRPLLEQNIDLQLPAGGKQDMRQIDRNNIRVAEVTPKGDFWLAGKHLSPGPL